MQKKISVLNLSGIYEQEAFYKCVEGLNFVDLRHVPGTNCMCDDAAKEILAAAIGGEGPMSGDADRAATGSACAPQGLHFIDNGNYHYISALYTSFIREPFSLVVLDHHPDMQSPMFDILSCGGWVLYVLENNEYVRDIHIIGADPHLISELDEKAGKRVKFYDPGDVFVSGAITLPETQYPVYLSIDKDVIRRDELVTNWDQGELTQEQVLGFMKALLSREGSAAGENADKAAVNNDFSGITTNAVPGGRGIIGIDICGECAPEQEDCDLEAAITGNDLFNERVLRLL